MFRLEPCHRQGWNLNLSTTPLPSTHARAPPLPSPPSPQRQPSPPPASPLSTTHPSMSTPPPRYDRNIKENLYICRLTTEEGWNVPGKTWFERSDSCCNVGHEGSAGFSKHCEVLTVSSRAHGGTKLAWAAIDGESTCSSCDLSLAPFGEQGDVSTRLTDSPTHRLTDSPTHRLAD